MSLLSREKGKRGERAVATMLRRAFPGTVVYRSMQADRPYQPDVVVSGHRIGALLWTEVTDSRAPNPRKKLVQAERDANRRGSGERLSPYDDVLPLVVWHRTGERTWWATLRLETLMKLLDVSAGGLRGAEMVVTMPFTDLLSQVAKAAP